MEGQHGYTANIAVWSGMAEDYATLRPAPPPILVDILRQLAGSTFPMCVVDLGSGTGLSTRLWARDATSVIGVEPNAEMRRVAEATTTPDDPAVVAYRDGSAQASGLPDGCADFVTVAQALHWMEPASTIAEIARLLRPSGVFAAYDCDWPPAMNVEAERAYHAFIQGLEAIATEQGRTRTLHRWKTREYEDHLAASGQFRYLKRFAVHTIMEGTAERFLQLACTSPLWALRQERLAPDHPLLSAFRSAVQAALGDDVTPWYLTYRVLVAARCVL